MGSLPRSDHGKKYVLVAVDYLSKMVVARGVPDATSQTSIQSLLEQIIHQHGVLEQVVTDHGSTFIT